MHRLIPLLLAALTLTAQTEPAPTQPPPTGYVLGIGDQISLSVENLNEDFADKTFRIDLTGDVNLPLAGRLHAAGLNLHDFEVQVQDRLARFVKDPSVVASVTEFTSQPVSVLGAVNNAGVKQIVGRRSLFEVLSLAGGLRADAGSSIKITRNLDKGPIPLASAKTDSTGRFSVASVDVKAILNATDPAQNINVLPGDVISVSKADMVYAVGSVTKAGGFALNQDRSLSALQVLSLAGGLTHTAALERSAILRTVPGQADPQQVPINLKQIMAGKSPDVRLEPNDILFVPNSTGRTVAYKALDVITMAAAYGRIY